MQNKKAVKIVVWVVVIGMILGLLVSALSFIA